MGTGDFVISHLARRWVLETLYQSLSETMGTGDFGVLALLVTIQLVF